MCLGGWLGQQQSRPARRSSTLFLTLRFSCRYESHRAPWWKRNFCYRFRRTKYRLLRHHFPHLASASLKTTWHQVWQ